MAIIPQSTAILSEGRWHCGTTGTDPPPPPPASEGFPSIFTLPTHTSAAEQLLGFLPSSPHLLGQSQLMERCISPRPTSEIYISLVGHLRLRTLNPTTENTYPSPSSDQVILYNLDRHLWESAKIHELFLVFFAYLLVLVFPIWKNVRHIQQSKGQYNELHDLKNLST